MKKYFIYLLLVMTILWISCSSDNGEDIQVTDPVEDSENTDPDPTAAETIYFPPLEGAEWETITMSELGWNESAVTPLLDLLEEKNSKAFIVLKNGRIVLEAYFNGASASDNNPWYSAGKTLTAFTTGIAQSEGFLDIFDSSVTYLDKGWSSLTETQEDAITIWNHLTMTTGLDFNIPNVNCTTPDCLLYLNDPGEFWFYHNAGYTLVQNIIEGAVDENFDSYFNSKLRDRIGMQGQWIKLGFANVYYSTARSMARFGLLSLNEGVWNDATILDDFDYFKEMTTTSQDLNEAYGYLWWLNGKGSFRAPASEILFPGKLIPSAPDDLIAGLGKNDQKLYVVPSEDLVIVRMGDNAGGSFLGPSSFDTELWEKISALIN